MLVPNGSGANDIYSDSRSLREKSNFICTWLISGFVVVLGPLTRPPQYVDVLAVLDFQIPCFRPETPGFYPRCLLTKHEGHERKLGGPR